MSLDSEHCLTFSLIIPTKGRVSEVRDLLHSLKQQNFQDFEIIVSDQNEDNRLLPIIKESGLDKRIIHLKSSGGISAAKNEGLNVARGKFIGFPDDDCRYPPDLLEKVFHFFESHPEYGMLSGRSYSDDGSDSVSKHATQSGEIQKFSIYSQCIEFAFFVRRGSLGKLRYDELMGVGALSPWNSDEGPDLILRLMQEGIRGFYEREIGVWHPRPVTTISEITLRRTYAYSCGSGYFLRKHHYPFWYFLYLILRPSAGVFLGAARFDDLACRFYWLKIRGRITGYLGYQKTSKKSDLALRLQDASVTPSNGSLEKASVIVINYNNGNFLKECIESALNQSYRNCEVIVVDDGSTDHSREIIGIYGTQIHSVIQSNKGQMAAYQSGLAVSSGQTVLFLDSDDYLHPDCIRRCMEVWSPNISKIHFYLEVVDENGHSLFSRVPTGSLDSKDAKKQMELYSSYSSPPGSGNLFSADFLKRILLGLNPEELRQSADAVPIYAAPFYGIISSIPEILGYYRRHTSANTSLKADSKKEKIKTWLLKEHCRDLLRDKSWRSVVESPPMKTGFYLKEPTRFKRLICYCRLNNYKGYEDETLNKKDLIFLGTKSILSWESFTIIQKLIMITWMILLTLLPLELSNLLIGPALFREQRLSFLKYIKPVYR